MERRRRRAGAWAALALVLATASACAPTGPDAGERGSSHHGVVHLSAWTIGPDAPSYSRKANLLEGARRLNQELAAAGDPTRVELAADFFSTGHEAYAKKLVFAFASGNGPDIVCGGHELIGQFAPTGALVDLGPYLAADHAFAADVLPVLWPAMRHAGRTYGVPQDNEVRLIYYRTDRLRDLGWTPEAIASLPERIERGAFALEDLAALGEAAVARGVVEPDRGFYHRTRAGPDWLAYLLAYGGRLEDPATGRLVLSRRAARSTFALIDRMVRARVIPRGMTSYREDSIHRGFTEGKVLGYVTGGSWHKLEWQVGFGLDDARFRAEVGFAPIPGGRPAAPPGVTLERVQPRPVTVSHPFACMLTTAGADPRLAFRVVRRALDPDLDVSHALGSSHLVVRKSSSELPAFRGDPFLQRMIELLRYTRFEPNHAKLPRLLRVVFDAIRGIEVGMLTPDEALTFAEEVGRARLGDDLLVED